MAWPNGLNPTSGFPAFSPSRYSSRSFGDVRNHKIIYDKLVKHFDKFGFPQPIAQKQGDVGLIRDWRFLAGDSPARYYDVEKADKTIGETFGRVLHWLICSADRLPNGQAVIAYYLQHIELIKWIGQRMGYTILYGATDFDMSGAHSKMDKHCRGIFNTWMVLMPSERARATRRASSANWAQTHMAVAAQVSPMQISQPQPAQQQRGVLEGHQNTENAPIVVPIVQHQTLLDQAMQSQSIQTQGLPPQVPQSSLSPGQSPLPQSQAGPVPHFISQSSAPNTTSPLLQTIDERLDDVTRDFNEVIVPQCEGFLSMPPIDPNSRFFEYRRLTQHIERNMIGWLDALLIPEGHPARKRRKEMIIEAQQLLQSLDVTNRPPSVADTLSIASTPSVASPPPAAIAVTNPIASSVVTASPVEKPSMSTPTTSPHLIPSQQTYPVTSASPPPYSPDTPLSIVSPERISNPASYPFPAKKPVRRKAPPPPKKVLAAKALYDFEPEEDNDEELAFKEGDDIEIIEKTAALEEEGWCRAKVKGQKKLGLAPLEYLEIVEKPPTLQPTASAPSSSVATVTAVDPIQPAPPAPLSVPTAVAADPIQHELHGSETQTYHGTSDTNQISETAHLNSTMYAPSNQPSYPAVYSFPYPSPYPSEPHSYPTNHQDHQHKHKSGKPLEVAKLAVATAGAATGIASYVQQKHSSENQSTNDASQQGPLLTDENAAVNQRYDPAQQPIQNNDDTKNITQNNDNNNNSSRTNITQNPIDPTITTSPPTFNSDTSPPLPVDLSAYSSSPFDPQSQPDDSNPITSITAINPYSTPQTSSALSSAPNVISNSLVTGVPQDVIVYPNSPVLVATSPFSSSVVDSETVVATDDGGDDVFYDQDY